MAREPACGAKLPIIRYAQVWEDADILLEALEIGPGDECLSIASAGDNALAMLARGPRRVVVLDSNPSQLACLALRVEAFRRLEYHEILELVGSVPSERRAKLYDAIRPGLSKEALAFWDARPHLVDRGVGHAGKFENYFRIFRERVIPLVHSRRTVAELFLPRQRDGRRIFYENTWNTWRWRLLFRIFFSRTVMGAFGRDPCFFRYVEGGVAEKLLSRARHAVTELDPSENPYLRWILTGGPGDVLPFYLREENFAAIRANLDRLEWNLTALEDFLPECGPQFTKFNLSDIFEYLSIEKTGALLREIAASSLPGARLAYWNMLVPRSAAGSCCERIMPIPELAARLHQKDKAFFYSAFVVEEVR